MASITTQEMGQETIFTVTLQRMSRMEGINLCPIYKSSSVGVMYRYFVGKEDLLDKLVDIATFAFAIIIFLVADSGGVTKDTAYIPTITNGIAASTSIIVAATGLVLAFANANRLIQRRRPWTDPIYCTFLFVIVAISFVFLAYVALMWGDYVKAIRTAMGGLVIALATFTDFTFLVLRRYIKPTLPK